MRFIFNVFILIAQNEELAHSIKNQQMSSCVESLFVSLYLSFFPLYFGLLYCDPAAGAAIVNAVVWFIIAADFFFHIRK